MTITTTQNLYDESTVSSARAFNPRTQEVMDYIAGKRTKEQIIREFFGFHIYFSYDEDGNIIKTHDEAESERMIQKYQVEYHPRLKELGVSQDDFYGFFPSLKNNSTNHTDNEGDKQSNGTVTLESSVENSGEGMAKDTRKNTITHTEGKNIKKATKTAGNKT